MNNLVIEQNLSSAKIVTNTITSNTEIRIDNSYKNLYVVKEK